MRTLLMESRSGRRPGGTGRVGPAGEGGCRRFGQAGALALLAFMLAALPGCSTPPRSASAPPMGQPRGADATAAIKEAHSVGELGGWWETDDGAEIRLSGLAGRVRLISMFYSTCQGVCLLTSREMREIEATLPPAVRERVGFVLVTLDPTHDRVPVLRSYRRDQGLSPARWTLLRGGAAETDRLAALLGIIAGRDASGRFVHSSELVILDEGSRIVHRHPGAGADLAAIAREMEQAAGAKRGP